VTSAHPSSPRLLWNASPSVPVGLYAAALKPPCRGELALINLPEPYRRLAAGRGYLPAGVLLIKPVAAGAGDVVCRHGPLLTINGRQIAYARNADRRGRPLPRWGGCRSLRRDRLLVLSEEPDSFDGRYFGVVDGKGVVGTALPVAVVPKGTAVEALSRAALGSATLASGRSGFPLRQARGQQ